MLHAGGLGLVGVTNYLHRCQCRLVESTAVGSVLFGFRRRLASDLDLDADTILAQMDSDAVTQVIAQNRALAQALSISGTPSFVVDDELLRGFLPADQMQIVVDEKRG